MMVDMMCFSIDDLSPHVLSIDWLSTVGLSLYALGADIYQVLMV